MSEDITINKLTDSGKFVFVYSDKFNIFLFFVSKKDGKKFGGSESRQLLGLPTENTRVKPGDFGDWRIFIQSTSLNRKIKTGTSIFVKE